MLKRQIDILSAHAVRLGTLPSKIGHAKRSCFRIYSWTSTRKTLARLTDICNYRYGMGMANFGQQLPIRQNHPKALEIDLQFIRNSFVSIPEQIRPACIQAQCFFPRKIPAYQLDCISFTNKVCLHHKESTKGIAVTNVATSGVLATEKLTPRQQGRNVTLSLIIPSAGNNIAITPEEYCMLCACRDLNVWHFPIQRWDVTLSGTISSTSNRIAITLEKHRVIIACIDLCVFHVLIQRWNAACMESVSISISWETVSIAITMEKHCVIKACRSLGVENPFIQGWKLENT